MSILSHDGQFCKVFITKQIQVKYEVKILSLNSTHSTRARETPQLSVIEVSLR